MAARSLSYWLRDRRYLVNVVIVRSPPSCSRCLLVAASPSNLAVLLPVPIMALFFGWLPHNDLAYDSTRPVDAHRERDGGVSDRIAASFRCC